MMIRLDRICLPLLLLAPGLIFGGDFPVADEVIIDKSDRELHLLNGGEIFRTFKIALGIRPDGDKKKEGDFKTPEGRYLLDLRNPNSDYFLSIHVSYPSAVDRQEAKLSSVSPGGEIMIHGQPSEGAEEDGDESMSAKEWSMYPSRTAFEHEDNDW